MSYCRFGEGDVYVFLNVGGYLDCCGCILREYEWVDDETRPIFKGYFKPIGEIIHTEFFTTADMINHLQLHIDKGHHVPNECIKALLEDQEVNDKLIKGEK